ncbi:MAG: ANTAR domain-containing response regulator [Oscillospiraceae bacterium]
MGNTLIVSSAEQTAANLISLIKQGAGGPFVCAASGADARRKATEREFELCLINAPLSDEFGDGLAVFLAQKTTACQLLIVKAEIADEVAAKVEEQGVLVLPKPVSKALLFQTVKLAAVTRRQLLNMQKENAKLQSRIEELRVVDRAKCALIQYRGMTEPEAHHYIEKQAMDNRITRREVAADILNTFE